MKNKICTTLLCTFLMIGSPIKTSQTAGTSNSPSIDQSLTSTPRTNRAAVYYRNPSSPRSTTTTILDHDFRRVIPTAELPMGRQLLFGIAQQPPQPALQNMQQVQRPVLLIRNLTDQTLHQNDRRHSRSIRHSSQNSLLIPLRSRKHKITKEQHQPLASLTHTSPQQPGSPSYAEMVRRNMQSN